jgi:hypothetical protein
MYSGRGSMVAGLEGGLEGRGGGVKIIVLLVLSFCL